MNLTIQPLTPSLWPALEALFGKGGASNGCWCMYWRIGPEYHKRPRDKNKSALRRIVKQGPPPGLLAFDGDLAVGWCQLTPRQDLTGSIASQFSSLSMMCRFGPSRVSISGAGIADEA
jgi:hypothetical protein